MYVVKKSLGLHKLLVKIALLNLAALVCIKARATVSSIDG